MYIVHVVMTWPQVDYNTKTTAKTISCQKRSENRASFSFSESESNLLLILIVLVDGDRHGDGYITPTTGLH